MAERLLAMGAGSDPLEVTGGHPSYVRAPAREGLGITPAPERGGD